MKIKSKLTLIFIICFILLMNKQTTLEASVGTSIPLTKPALEIQKIEISSIEQSQDLTRPIIINLNDTNDFNYKISILKEQLETVTGITNINTQVSLTLDTLMTDSIQLNKNGTYEIKAVFKIESNSKDTQYYYLLENPPTLTIPVYILNQTNFNFSEIIETDDTIAFILKNIPLPNNPVQLFFKINNNYDNLEAPIKQTDFNESPDKSLAEIQNKNLIINKNALITGINYYLFIQNDYYYSDIIHIKSNGSTLQYEFITSTALSEQNVKEQPKSDCASQEARLGKFEEPDIIQAPPDESTVINTSSSASDLRNDSVKTTKLKKQFGKIIPRASEPVILHEEVTDTMTKISGTRLNYMLQIYPDYVPFEHQGILLRIPSEFLKNLGISETSYFTVEIQKEDDFSFLIMISIDGNEIINVPHAQIQFPVMTESNLKLYYNNHLTDTVMTIKNNMAAFEINNTGHYKLEAIAEDISPSANMTMSSLSSRNEPAVNIDNTIIVIISVLMFIILILISLYRRRKEYQ